MKISSKSILSPNRPTYSREPPPPPPPIALSTSLARTRSRRLTNSRSIKGAASPAMFPVVTGKKRGSGFDNPEPSSPKVTCIGQVRVKTKMKHAKNIRSLSRRRKLEHSRSLRKNSNSNIYNNNNNNTNSNNNNNRQWVHHIPLTICETLRTFGSEVSCLFPCRSPCLSTENNEERKHEWVVALKDEEEEMEVGNNVRRHVFDGLEIVNDVVIGSRDEGRVSICVPPKNALLLMRCRSDPEMMEALTNRVWEPMLEINEEKDGEICEEGLQMEGEKLMVLDDVDVNDEAMEDIILEMEMKQTMQDEEDDDEEDQEQRMETNEEEEEDSFFLGFLFEENLNEKETDMRDAEEELFEDKGEDVEEEESNIEKVKHVEESIEISVIQEEVNEESETWESNVEKVKQIEEEIEDMLTEFNERSEIQVGTYEEIEVGESNIEKVNELEERNEQMLTEFTESPEKSYEELFEDEDVQETESGESNIEQFEDEDEDETETGESNVVNAKQSDEEFEEMLTEFTEEIEVENGGNEEREKIEALPECLLLMMYEPKLSMEVSKETWVRSSDFIRRHSSKKKPPPPPPLPTEPIDNNVTNMVAVQYEPVAQQQPARSSCSFPAAAPRSIIAVLEEKLVMGFEPLALSRCKSEPMRRARESCSWQNQLEPPRRASFGVGMAGLG